ncbi:toxic anion resistance protein [Thaumasiovibrio subtropicus]|uniref:toxic anion resistance protein n=1 Tax=Thaumasiovibrio subtropicus TaxID=1891207 RepID=UPI000B3574C8|nr:toxic anion resistance protein [Thaumasiovibrio subtropicus]
MPMALPADAIVAIADAFDPYDSVSTITFGKEAQQSLTDFTDSVLENVRLRDAGDAGEMLQSMIATMDGSQFDEVNKSTFLSRLPLIGELFCGFKKFAQGFDSVKSHLEELTKSLEAQSVRLAHDVRQLDTLYDENLALLKGLEEYIEAGRWKIHQLKEAHLPVLLKAAQESGDALEAQAHRDAQQVVARLEKRVHNLELSRMAAIQTAPQIRLSQEGNQIMMEDIQDIVHNTLPMWKRQFLIAISNFEKEKALKVTRAVKDYTNQQYVQNAEKLKVLEEQIAENYQRGVLDLDSLQTVNQLTIETLNNTLSRVKEGREKREHAQRVIAEAEKELKLALQQTISD